MLFIPKTNIQIAIFAGWFVFLASSAGLASQDNVSDIHAKIQTQKKIVKTFSQKEINILDRLNEIDHGLNKARIKALALSKEILRLQEKIGQLSQDKNSLQKKIDLTRKYAGKRLTALYKMNMIGRLDVAGQPPSVFDFFLQQNSMKRVINADFQILEDQGSDLEKFETLEQELEKEIQAKTMLESKLNAQIMYNKQESKKKGLLLKDIH